MSGLSAVMVLLSGCDDFGWWLVESDVDAGLRAAPARVVEAGERRERLATQLRWENAALRTANERVSAELAVLQRLVFGRSSERVRPVLVPGMRRW